MDSSAIKKLTLEEARCYQSAETKGAADQEGVPWVL